MPITATPIPCLSDNTAWLLQDSASGEVAIIDPPEVAPFLAALDAQAGGRCDWIFLTHHHGDHIAGAAELAARTGARIIGHAADAARLPALDLALRAGDVTPMGGRMLDTPGHTRGHVSFWFADGAVLACGDVLFAYGCGRFAEGTAEEMFSSFRQYDPLPGNALVCCGHEYTESNLRFCLHDAPGDPVLTAAAARVAALRAAGKPSVPTTLWEERRANPFLRAGSAAELGRLREAKNAFRG
jgi:hydroxyacylglutathione hydrolase